MIIRKIYFQKSKIEILNICWFTGTLILPSSGFAKNSS